MSVKYLRRGKRAGKLMPKLLPDPKSSNFLFIVANAYAKKEQHRDYKGSKSLFCLFHLFFFFFFFSNHILLSTCVHQRPQVLAQSSCT